MKRLMASIIGSLLLPLPVADVGADSVDATVLALAQRGSGGIVREMVSPVVSQGVSIGLARAGGRPLTTLTSQTPQGVSVMGVLRERATAIEFDVSIPAGAHYEAQGDGSLLVVSAGSAAVSVAAVIVAPWALDATGRALPTWYEIRGRGLTQRIDVAGAKFPVVADPKITGVGLYAGVTLVVYVQYSRTEMRRARDIINSSGYEAAAYGLCVLVPSTYGQIACAILMGIKLDDLRNNLNTAWSNGECLKARIPVGSLTPIAMYPAMDYYREKCE